MSTQILHTDRLTLRPFCMEDADAMFRNWTQDADVARFCRWHPHADIAETRAFLQTCIGKEFAWAITVNGSDEVIGSVDVVDIPSADTCEIGYLLAKKYWSRGLMSEAVKAVINHLFACGFRTVTAVHHVENPASGRVMEKCGMRYQHNGMTPPKFDSNELCEIRCYAITKE